MATPPEDLDALRRDADGDIRQAVGDWAAALYGWAIARTLMANLLEDGHMEAHRLGRAHGGENDGLTREDEDAGLKAWKADSRFWNRLDRQVRQGKYGTPGDDDNPPQVDALTKRVGLYHTGWVGTANAAWVGTLAERTGETEDDELFEWVMHPAAEHCSDCARWARNGPYTIDEIPALPGDSTSACKLGCRCELRNVGTGQTGFRP